MLHAVADEALAVEEAVEEHACRSHRHLGQFEEFARRLDEIAAQVPQVRLHLSRHSVEGAGGVGQLVQRQHRVGNVQLHSAKLVLHRRSRLVSPALLS